MTEECQHGKKKSRKRRKGKLTIKRCHDLFCFTSSLVTPTENKARAQTTTAAELLPKKRKKETPIMSATTFAVNAMPTVCRGGRTSASAARRVSLHSTSPTVALTTPKLRASKRSTPAMMIRASDGEAAPAATATPMEPVPGTFSKICALEDLPRGDRKKVTALGKSILLFWYKAGFFLYLLFFLFFFFHLLSSAQHTHTLRDYSPHKQHLDYYARVRDTSIATSSYRFGA